MLQPNSPVKGLDGSNWQGELTAADVAEIKAAGFEFAIIRLSLEDAPRRALSVQQAKALIAGGVPVMGYGWAYFAQGAKSIALGYAQLATDCDIDIVWLDAEEAVSSDEHPVAWLEEAYAVLFGAGATPGYYTYTYWPSSYTVDVSPLDAGPWWIANANGRDDLTGYEPYPGALVFGHQYGSWTDHRGQTFDTNEFRFPEEWTRLLNSQVESQMTPDEVRQIVREELDSIAAAADGASSLGQLLGAIIARIGAAGKALSTDQPVP